MALSEAAKSKQSIMLLVEGTSCASCVAKVEKALHAVEGVDKAEMNFADRSVSVSGNAKAAALIKAIEQAGYQAKLPDTDQEELLLEERQQADAAKYKLLMRDTWLALALGVPLMLYGLITNDMTADTTIERWSWLAVGLLTFLLMVFPGRHFYVGAWQSIKNHSANMDTLIALGTGTAWLYSMVVVLVPEVMPEMTRHIYFEATAMIIGLVNLGLALELKARGQTSAAIARLIGLQTKTALVIRDEQELSINIDQVILNDIVKVRPGEKVPVDGVVIEGRTAIDESMLTGEPMPVEKLAKDTVSAGTINKTGTILFKATRVGKDTALAQIIQMVKRAQNAKPAIGRLADVISAYFVPAVMIIAVLTALAWLNFGTEPSLAVITATTVLIIACPCALGLATPMSVMVGVGKAAEAGVLIRNGEALQTASKVQVMLLDKTGTITQGSPKLTDIKLAEGFEQAKVLQLAASLESGSEHPLAQAILEAAKEQNISLDKVTDFNAIAGHGVSANLAGQSLLFGNEKLMRKHNIDINAFIAPAQALAEQAKTPMYFVVAGKFAAILAVSDPIKNDSIAAIKRLQHNGIKVMMLTGDNKATAAAVAKAVGITEYFAEVLPEHKSDKVKDLQQQGYIVGMTGDGINDAPALALSNVGFAIGTGTDVAIESADITLMRGSLHGLADAIAISKATLTNIKQNLFGAFIYNVAGIPIAAGILYPFWGILLNPVVAGAAMALSSVTVVTNANRLRLFKPKQH